MTDLLQLRRMSLQWSVADWLPAGSGTASPVSNHETLDRCNGGAAQHPSRIKAAIIRRVTINRNVDTSQYWGESAWSLPSQVSSNCSAFNQSSVRVSPVEWSRIVALPSTRVYGVSMHSPPGGWPRIVRPLERSDGLDYPGSQRVIAGHRGISRSTEPRRCSASAAQNSENASMPEQKERNSRKSRAVCRLSIEHRHITAMSHSPETSDPNRSSYCSTIGERGSAFRRRDDDTL